MERKTAPAQPIPGVDYPGLGDLSRFDAVKIKSRDPSSKETYEADDSIMIHLTITGRCYAQCKGCVNSKHWGQALS